MSPSPGQTLDEVRVTRLATRPSPEVCVALTQMLHRAYAEQMRMGLRPLAGRQSSEITCSRCESGETFVARRVNDDRFVGMILFEEVEEATFPDWFLRDDVAHFSLFAVDPDVQGLGVGSVLLDAVDRRAAELGRAELALSMAEPDRALLEYYFRRGFRFVQHWRWPYVNYRSAILSRAVKSERRA